MSIERNLLQQHWGVMRTDVQSVYQRRDGESNIVDLVLDGSYYGVVGNLSDVNTINRPVFHLLGMVQRVGTAGPLTGKSVFAIYQEDRDGDRLVYRSYFVLDGVNATNPIYAHANGSLNAAKTEFGENPISLLKDNRKCFSVNRTQVGFELSYLADQGNSYFRARYAVNQTTGIASLYNIPVNPPAVEMRKNTDTSYRTWQQIFNTQLNLTGPGREATAVEVIRPFRTWNNNQWDNLGPAIGNGPGTSYAGTTASGTFSGSTQSAAGTVFIINIDPDSNGDSLPDQPAIVSHIWPGAVSATVTNDLSAWWNSKLPLDTFNTTLESVQYLNHPTAGLLAIYQKDRQSDNVTRRYFADFTNNDLTDMSVAVSDNNFVLDKMVASSVNITCFHSYNNDKHDSTGGRLVYIATKPVGVSAKVNPFSYRLLNYDLDGNAVTGFVSNNNTYITSVDGDNNWPGTDNWVKSNGPKNEIGIWAGQSPTNFGFTAYYNDVVYLADAAPLSTRSFRLEREDMGSCFTDGIGTETYYLTGIRGLTSLGKPIFVAYSTYQPVVGNFALAWNGSGLGITSQSNGVTVNFN